MAAYAKGMSKKQAIAAKKGESKSPKKRGLKPAKDRKVAGVPF
jgi:hypothetical protein